MGRGKCEYYVPISKSKVKKALKETGRTQLEMCEMLGLSYTAFNRRLSEGNVSRVYLLAMAYYLNVSASWLINDEEGGSRGV